MASLKAFYEEGHSFGLSGQELKDYASGRQKEEEDKQQQERETRRLAREEAKEAREHELAMAQVAKEVAERQAAEAERNHARQLELIQAQQSNSLTDTSFSAPRIKLPMYKEGEEVEPFIHRFERFADKYGLSGVAKDLQFLSLFQDKPLSLLHRLDNDRSTYEHMKSALLEAYGLTCQAARTRFFQSRLEDKETCTQFLARVSGYLDVWLMKDETPVTVEGLKDLMIRTQVERSAPSELVAEFKLSKVRSSNEMAAKADAFFEAHGYQKRRIRNNNPNNKNNPKQASSQAGTNPPGKQQSTEGSSNNSNSKTNHSSPGQQVQGNQRSWGNGQRGPWRNQRQESAGAQFRVEASSGNSQGNGDSHNHDL